MELFILVCVFASSTSTGISQVHMKRKYYDCEDMVPRSRICVADAKEDLSEASRKVLSTTVYTSLVSLFSLVLLCLNLFIYYYLYYIYGYTMKILFVTSVHINLLFTKIIQIFSQF